MRKGMILVGNYFTSGHTSAASDQFRAIQKMRDDIEVVHSRDLGFSVSDGKLTCHLPDGTSFTNDSPNKPRWVMDRDNTDRVTFILEQMGIRCFPSSETVRISKDKSMSQALLSGHIPSLDGTLIVEREIDGDVLASRSGGYPYILKTPQGHGGKGVHKIEDPQQMREIVDDNGYKMSSILTQEMCERGDDIRVYVLGDKIVLAVMRRVRDGEWKANFDFTPEYSEYALSADERKEIEDAVRLFPEDRGLMSVDMLVKDGRLVLCETNTNPAIDAMNEIEKANGFMERYVEWLDKQCEVEE